MLPECHHGGDYSHAVDPFAFGKALLSAVGFSFARLKELEKTRSALIESLQALDALIAHLEADASSFRQTHNAKVTGAPALSASPRGLTGYPPPLPRDGCPASNAINGKHERDAYGTCGLCGHGKGYPK